jgi:hypothetical protein
LRCRSIHCTLTVEHQTVEHLAAGCDGDYAWEDRPTRRWVNSADVPVRCHEIDEIIVGCAKACQHAGQNDPRDQICVEPVRILSGPKLRLERLTSGDVSPAAFCRDRVGVG